MVVSPWTRGWPVEQGSGRSFEEFFAATYGRLVGLLFAFLHDQAQACACGVTDRDRVAVSRLKGAARGR
jgi:hypothetical protein